MHRKLRITALETLNFEARFSKEVEVILWRSSETAMLSSVYPKVELPTLKSKKKQFVHEFIYCRCVVNLERSSQNVFKVITIYAGSETVGHDCDDEDGGCGLINCN